MDTGTIAIIISSISIGISITSLFWSVYSEIFLRPLTTTSAQISYIYHGKQEYGPYISIHIQNKGPGKMQISNIVFICKRSIKDIVKKTKYKGNILYDWDNPYNPKLMIDIERYDTYSQHLHYEKNCIFSEKIKKLGFVDSMNRYHWIRKKDLKLMVQTYKKEDFEKIESKYNY